MIQDIHEYVRENRIGQQLSIQELSKLSGVSASHISRIERGNRKPSPRTLEKLAPHLSVSYMNLLEVANLIHSTSSEKVSLEEVLMKENLLYKESVITMEIKKQIIQLLEQKKD